VGLLGTIEIKTLLRSERDEKKGETHKRNEKKDINSFAEIWRVKRTKAKGDMGRKTAGDEFGHHENGEWPRRNESTHQIATPSKRTSNENK